MEPGAGLSERAGCGGRSVLTAEEAETAPNTRLLPGPRFQPVVLDSPKTDFSILRTSAVKEGGRARNRLFEFRYPKMGDVLESWLLAQTPAM
jgi:hypothetical protein